MPNNCYSNTLSNTLYLSSHPFNLAGWAKAVFVETKFI